MQYYCDYYKICKLLQVRIHIYRKELIKIFWYMRHLFFISKKSIDSLCWSLNVITKSLKEAKYVEKKDFFNSDLFLNLSSNFCQIMSVLFYFN